jgi:predicted enzyme related to lactoylglutathione lyase
MAHLPGKFVWFELNTKSFDKAIKFYGELFGWKVNKVSMGGPDYHMINNGEIPIGGLTDLEGNHPHWISYLSVDNVDQTVAKVKKAGGKVVREAMDYPNVGRFALVSDPQGGLLFAFRAEKEDAPDRDTKQGDWYWNELICQEPGKAAKFYADAFGVTPKRMEMPGMEYHVLEANGVPRAGIMSAPSKEVPTSWLPYVRVDKVDEIAKRASKLGGQVMMEPTDIPTVGRFAVLKDSDGAAIAVITPASQS